MTKKLEIAYEILSELDIHICELDDFRVLLNTFAYEYGETKISCECGKHNQNLHDMIGGLFFTNRYIKETVKKLRDFSEESYDLYFASKKEAAES